MGFKDSEPIYSDDEDLLGFPDPLSIADIPSSDLLDGFEDDMMDNDHDDNDFHNEVLLFLFYSFFYATFLINTKIKYYFFLATATRG